MKKSELREIFKAKRQTLTDSELEHKSESITKQIFSSLEFSDVSYIHIFLTITRHREIDTSNIISEFRRNFPAINICVPRIIPGEDQFESVVLLDDTDIQINDFGVPEPIGSGTVGSELMDVVFVPLLCADKKGFRVGYGRGFYDRFLEECRPDCRKVGLSMFPLIESVGDIRQHDVPVDSVIVA